MPALLPRLGEENGHRQPKSLNVKYIKLLISLSITIALIAALNSRIGVIPPFGKFLDPFKGFWQNCEPVDKWKDGELKLPGLKDEVKVYFDKRLVPHIFAKNDEDLYYMQGYITAKYRLWQMEIQTHFAAGRVSEITGGDKVDIDKMQRRIGLAYGAQQASEYIANDPESKKLIESYCNGVNAFIKNLQPRDYPFEYKLLNYAPEEWTPIKVGLLLKNMANQLAVFEYDIENNNFISKYGMEAFRHLYPDFIADEDPIIPTGNKWDNLANWKAEDINGKPVAGPTATNNAISSPIAELFPQILEKPDEITGSNNWAVAGTKTKSGKPILCNDPHLRLGLPSIWYEMHLVSPNMNTYGATIPGSPAVIIGFNDSIAWGETNAGRDVRDWYKVKFKDARRDEYEVDGKWVKSEKHIEHIKIRGKGEVLDTVIYTKFGIVMFDESVKGPQSRMNLAVKWTGHLPSNEFKTFYKLNKAKNYDEYIDALNYYTCPAQNFVFSSRSGDIAIKEQGRFPIRDKATEQGKYISDGTKDNHEWETFIPSASNPLSKNPERGFVSSANQHPTDTTYPYYYPGLENFENYRNRRINKMLGEANGIDVDFMKKMQNDNYNLFASEALPVLLNLLDKSSITEHEKKILESLKKWNFYNNPQEVAPVYFEIWWSEMRRLLWDEMYDREAPMKLPSNYVTVWFLKTDSTSAFYDNRLTPAKETRHDIVLQAFKGIDSTLKEKKFTESGEDDPDTRYVKADMKPHDWGSYKATKISHLLPGLDALSALNVYNGGNYSIVNATSTQNGPSWRMIVDEGEMKAYVVYPGGQSGNPGSPFYDNMIKAWAKGEYYQASFITKPEDLEKDKLFVLTFKP